MPETLGLTSNTYNTKNFLWSTENYSEKGITILSGCAAMVPGTIVVRQTSSGKYILYVADTHHALETIYTGVGGAETFVHEKFVGHPNIMPGSVVVTYVSAGPVTNTITCSTFETVQGSALGTVYVDYKNGGIALSTSIAIAAGGVVQASYHYFPTGLDYAQPVAIVTEAIDASGADQEVTAMITGHVWGDKLVPTLLTGDNYYWQREILRQSGIIVHHTE